MNVELISYRRNVASKAKRDLTIKLINKSKADLMLFAGHTISESSDLLYLRNRIENKKSSIFLELENIGARDIDNWCFKIEKGSLINCSTHQLFSTSKEISGNEFCAENLYNEIKFKRIHKVKGKKICTLICGELNILTNLQSKSNKVEFRVEDKELRRRYEELFNDVDIFLNPIHTPMGNQGKMFMRRKFLSINNRAYFSTANLNKPAKEANLSFKNSQALQYAYFNGKEIDCISSDNTNDYLLKEYNIKI